MRLSDLSAIVRAFSSLEHPYRVVVLEGSDDFFREDCTERYIEAWKGLSPDGLVVRSSAASVIARQQELCGGPSLFGTRELCVVEDLSGVTSKRGGELISVVESADENHDFLFVDSQGIPQDLSAVAEEKGAYCFLPPIKPWDHQPLLVKWIQAWMKKQGKGIESEAASILAKTYSGQREALLRELEMLYLYCLDEPTVTSSHIEAVGLAELQPTLWQLLDGLVAGDATAIATTLARSADLYDIAVLRFLKNQLEKLVANLEGNAPARNKSQERQMAAVRKRGLPTIISWINRLKMHEVAIRSGAEEAEEGTLLPFLLSLIKDS